MVDRITLILDTQEDIDDWENPATMPEEVTPPQQQEDLPMQPIITTTCQRCKSRIRITRRQYRYCYECNHCIMNAIREILEHAKQIGVIRDLFDTTGGRQ